MSRPADVPDYQSEVEACPFCGSTAGFYHKYADVNYTFYDWKGVAFETNNDHALFSRKLKCTDCHKVIEKFVKSYAEIE